MLRTQLYADPHNLFLRDVVLDSCRRNAHKTALVEASCGRRCGVVGRRAGAAGEVHLAFVALRGGFVENSKLGEELCAFVAERLTHYKTAA